MPNCFAVTGSIRARRNKMKIQLEILGMPTLSGIIGRKAEVEITGGTVRDLIEFFTRKYGTKAGAQLLNERGDLDMTIQVLLNDHLLPREELARHELQDGDRLKFMLLVGGG